MQQMIEVKTAELDGAALDWAVAQAEGRKARIYLCPVMDEYKVAATVPDGDLECAWMPSIDWGQGGPLIEKHRIEPHPYNGIIDGKLCSAWKVVNQSHTNLLVTSCRAIVAAKLGYAVSVPEELCQD